MNIPLIFWIVPAAAVIALAVAWAFYRSMKCEDEGTPRMREIAEHVRKGAMAYLRQQYKVVLIVFIILALFFAYLAYGAGVQNPWVPFAFLTGGFFSGLAGYFGMKTATYASARTANAARQSLDRGLKVAFRSGAVMGLVVVGLGLLDISFWYVILERFVEVSGPQKLEVITTTMLTFGMGASTLVFAAMMFAFDWRLAASALWPIPVALAALLLTARIQKSHTAKKNAASLSFADGLQEYLECHREIRSLNKVGVFQGELDCRIDRFEREKIDAELAMGVAVCSAQGFLRLGIASVIVVGTMLLVTGQVDFLVFFVYLLAATRVYDPINVVLQAVAELMDMSLSLERMRAIENEPVQTGSTSFEPQGYDVVFEDVGFAYADGEDVLGSVSFKAREGQVTALVGASGSGKSTAVKLASRFWDVSSGTVFVGGVDVSTVDPETLLSAFSEVFQDVVLFDDTVRENIRLGKKDATNEEVLAAARAARCDEFVERLPSGYDTMIGENGSRLSGGERQRISIARALLKDAPIVLLDEATASLDVENETHVQAALSELLQGKTVLVIAHRMRTVDNADKIVVLEGGCVAEQGSPAELRGKPDAR